MQVVLLVFPGQPGAVLLDEAGSAALTLLRAMGLPTLIAAVQGPADAPLKDRAAGKKLADAAITAQVCLQSCDGV